MATSVSSLIAADLGSSSEPSQVATPAPDQQTQPTTTPVTQTGAETTTATEEAPLDEDFSLDLDTDPDADAEAAAPPALDQTDQKAAKPEGETDPDSEIGKLLATSRGRRIYAEFKKSQMLSEPEEKGGIGFAPSVEQVREFYQNSNDLKLMQHHFDTGDEKGINSFLKWWFGPQENGQARAGTQVLSQKLPELLHRVNPNLNVQLGANYSGRYVNAAIDRMLEAARSEKDEARQREIYMAAQHLHRDAYGKWFDPKARTAPQGTEPISAEISELNRLKSQLADDRRANFESSWQTFTKSTDSKIDQALEYDVDKALAKVKEHYTDTPLVYEGIRDRFVKEIQQAVRKNSEGMNRFNLRYEEAQRSMSPEDIRDIVRTYRQMAQQVIMARRAEYLKAAAVSLKQQSDATHGKLREASAKKNVTQAGQPAPADIRGALPQKLPNETHSDFMRRRIGADLTA